MIRMAAILINGTIVVSTNAPTREAAIAWLDHMIGATHIKAYVSWKLRDEPKGELR